MAKERAAIGGPGRAWRTTCKAVRVQPVTVSSCTAGSAGAATGPPPGGLAGLPCSSPLPPQAVKAPLTTGTEPSLRKLRRFIAPSLF
jgi:hypothetical protein